MSAADAACKRKERPFGAALRNRHTHALSCFAQRLIGPRTEPRRVAADNDALSRLSLSRTWSAPSPTASGRWSWSAWSSATTASSASRATTRAKRCTAPRRYRRATHELRRFVHLINRKRIARLIEVHGPGIKPSRSFVRTACVGCAALCCSKPPATGEMHPSHGQRLSIRQRDVPTRTAGGRTSRFDEFSGQSVSQCPGRELHEDPQGRGGVSGRLRDLRRRDNTAAAGDRRGLQRQATALGYRPPNEFESQLAQQAAEFR